MKPRNLSLILVLIPGLVAACVADSSDAGFEGSDSADGANDGERHALGKADAAGQCLVEDCGGKSSVGVCWCDDLCVSYNDCCSNVERACNDEPVQPGEPECGGFLGLACADGLTCVDDPSDECDPQNGGSDCNGICEVTPDPVPETCDAQDDCSAGFCITGFCLTRADETIPKSVVNTNNSYDQPMAGLSLHYLGGADDSRLYMTGTRVLNRSRGVLVSQADGGSGWQSKLFYYDTNLVDVAVNPAGNLVPTVLKRSTVKRGYLSAGALGCSAGSFGSIQDVDVEIAPDGTSYGLARIKHRRGGGQSIRLCRNGASGKGWEMIRDNVNSRARVAVRFTESGAPQLLLYGGRQLVGLTEGLDTWNSKVLYQIPAAARRSARSITVARNVGGVDHIFVSSVDRDEALTIAQLQFAGGSTPEATVVFQGAGSRNARMGQAATDAAGNAYVLVKRLNSNYSHSWDAIRRSSDGQSWRTNIMNMPKAANNANRSVGFAVAQDGTLAIAHQHGQTAVLLRRLSPVLVAP